MEANRLFAVFLCNVYYQKDIENVPLVHFQCLDKLRKPVYNKTNYMFF